MWFDEDDSAGFADALPDSFYAIVVVFVVGIAGVCLWVLL